MRIWVICAAAMLGLVSMAKAEPLELKQVAADAKWVVHIDVDAMRGSSVIEKAYYKVSDALKGAEQHLDKVRDYFGMDLRNDLHGVTVYSKTIGRPDGVLIVYANVDQKMLLEKAERAPDHKALKYGAYELHSWIDAKGKKVEHPVAGTFYKPNVIVFAPTFDALKAALDVLDGKSPSLAGKGSPLAAEIPAGTMVLARAVGLAGAKLPWKSPLVTQSDTFSLALGESQGQSFADAKLVTKSAETAQQVKAVVDGARAMAELQHGNDAEAMKLVRKFKVNADDKTICAEFRAPAEEVWAQIEKAWEQVAKHRKQRAGKR